MSEITNTKILPITENIKKLNWSYLYAYNIRIIRDLFIYCANKGTIDEKVLYVDMEQGKIHPPKVQWINKRRKREERLRLEYIHAAEYLGLINRNKGVVSPNFDTLGKEKKIILKENADRIIDKSTISPELTPKEKKAFLKIVLEYERARDFLRWFLDFSKYQDSLSFDIKDFKNEAKPIFILSKIEKGKKGSQILKREIDREEWKIPDEYIRLASYSGVFPMWFIELGIIDRVLVFPEFSDDKKLWYMFYPIKMNKKQLLEKPIDLILKEMFFSKTSQKVISVWIPHLLFLLAREFYCPVDAIKESIEKLYKEKFTSFYLERTSLQVMKKHAVYKDSYIKVDGFYRSTLKIIRG